MKKQALKVTFLSSSPKVHRSHSHWYIYITEITCQNCVSWNWTGHLDEPCVLGGELGSILRVPFAQAEVCLLMKSQASLLLARKVCFLLMLFGCMRACSSEYLNKPVRSLGWTLREKHLLLFFHVTSVNSLTRTSFICRLLPSLSVALIHVRVQLHTEALSQC